MLADLDFSPACEECGEEGLPLCLNDGRRVCIYCDTILNTEEYLVGELFTDFED
jgi:hypothetical protein